MSITIPFFSTILLLPIGFNSISISKSKPRKWVNFFIFNGRRGTLHWCNIEPLLLHWDWDEQGRSLRDDEEWEGGAKRWWTMRKMMNSELMGDYFSKRLSLRGIGLYMDCICRVLDCREQILWRFLSVGSCVESYKGN